MIHYGQRDDLLVHLQLTAPLSTSAVPCETQKEPDNLKNGCYQGPESNRPEGKRRSPPERALSWVLRHQACFSRAEVVPAWSEGQFRITMWNEPNVLPNGPPATVVREMVLITNDVQIYEVSKNTRPATVLEEHDVPSSQAATYQPKSCLDDRRD